MKEFFHSWVFKVLMALVVVMFAFLLRATLTMGFSTVVEQIVGTVTAPLQSLSASLSGSVTGFLDQFLHAQEIAEENERLKEENRQLIEQMVDYENYKNENESLKEQLQIQEDNPEWETMTASVIGRDPSDQFYSFTIDKGTLDGVSYQDPVITADGLVGIVSEVGPVFAKVTTILDVRLNVACQDVRTQDVATVSGDIELAQNGQCRMSLIPRESGIAKGDIIQTAGTSGLYPQGIVIGRVSDVGYEPSGTMMYAVVEPSS
ncbi:MAG TPA: rod shape-determining protein MreC, partial [Candidatus Negativibacillus faecipullorum]|nr:rod shape-determining protein MreC [Candidatus Negativibacillus faecipullorum]